MQEAIHKAEPSIACILVTRSDEPHNVNLASPAATELRMRAPFGAAQRGRSVPFST
jgi:hypothetical protein